MSYLFFILLIAAAVHLIYESLILPALHQHLRYALFRQRDRLRDLHISGAIADEKLFSTVHNSLNVAIQLVPHISYSVLYGSHKELSSNEKARARVLERLRLIQDSGNHEVQAIYAEMQKIALLAFMYNGLILFLLLLPVLIGILLVLTAGFQLERLVDFFRIKSESLAELMVTSDREIYRLVPAVEAGVVA